ncbi:hypothetical protein C3486_11445 [Streptomyces sp. Ru73]|uniref:hypothetical protein n=1 Tax=Streptomyces sp. Ru73 TaxID=2080748 RepID=UPI000D4B0B2D|nr:hypothetical protein [Streptomyces sp. Ru73]POX40993.1 hypothetical protein C3486_11445 [Streptomyces sp. Ru73]
MTRRTIRRGLAGPLAFGVLALFPGAAGAATPPTYAPAPDAEEVKGTSSTFDAPKIAPGLYTDSLERGEEKRYQLTLDGRTTAYVSAVAAPPPGTEVEDYTDGLTVSVQDSSGTTCGSDGDVRYRGGRTAYPLAAYAARRIGNDLSECQHAGPYYVVVKRSGQATAASDRWPVELRYMTEPALKGPAPGEPGEGSWSSATPAAPTGGAKKSVRGGTGFNDAASVGKGQWTDRILPGETRFYRVPVDWGQQLNVSAELPSSRRKEGVGVSTFVANAFGLTAYNPARGLVSAGDFVSYEGKQTEARLFTAPVNYGNRLSDDEAVSPMRFAGWYYLEVSLNPDAAKFFKKGADLTLRVDLKGAAKPGPQYAQPAADFSVTPEDRELAATGRTATEAEHAGHLRTVGFTGIGVGALLLAGLGGWTVAARRRAAAGATAVTGPAAGAPAGRGGRAAGQQPYDGRSGSQNAGQEFGRPR